MPFRLNRRLSGHTGLAATPCASGADKRDPAGRRLEGEELCGLLGPLLGEGISVRVKVSGTSMIPFIRDGDVVTVSPASCRALRLGDVVAVRRPRPGGLILHRVVMKRPGGFLIRGDNTSEGDGQAGDRDVLGVVTRVERHGRESWYGNGPLGPLVALLVRNNLVRRWNFWSARAARHRPIAALGKLLGK